MGDRVRYSKSLSNSDIPVFAITNDENPGIIQQVLYGNYSLVFSSPEWFVNGVKLHGFLRFVTFV